MKAIFWRTIKDRRVTIIAYSLGMIAFLWIYIAMFPSFAGRAEEFNKLLAAYPKQFLDAFGITTADQFFSSLENFLGKEYGFIWPVAAIALSVTLGGSAIAGEIEEGTIETLLQLPTSRAKIFFAKYLAGLVLILIFTILTIFTAIPLALAYHVKYQAVSYLTFAVTGFLFAWAIYSISYFFSVIFNSKGKSYFIPVGILMVMYVIKIVSSLKENLKNLQYYSFFYYIDVDRALSKHEILLSTYFVFGAVILIFTFAAVIWFSKRDIAVS
ncbi:MAG: ABC transporter permease subunit [Candidatus Berkelbacteria bacterium]|nr:ABC transporter permease subunit [Candidatus Berkelbacteria bacterium]